MLLELISLLAAGFVLASLALLAFQMVSNKIALAEFKKRSLGLPMHPDGDLLGNHAATVLIGVRSCQNLQKYHQQMGKTIGLLKGTTFCASTIDLNLIKCFIVDERGAHMDRISLSLPLKEFDETIMTAQSEEWPTLRKAIAPALAPSNFKTANVIEEIEQSIGKLVSLIERKLDANGPNGLIEADDLAARYSAAIVAKCLYKQDDLIDFDNPNDVWINMIESTLNSLNAPVVKDVLMSLPMFRGALDWFLKNFTLISFARRTVLEFITAQTQLAMEARHQLRKLRRETEKEGAASVDPSNFLLKDGTRFKRNMIDYVIDQFLDGKLTQAQYLNNSCFLMLAANRTASDCILHTIYWLSVRSDVQDKVRSSIQTDGSESEYLDWVLKESLRLLPPAPIGCSRTITRDIELDSGHVLPKGTFVLTNAYVIHRLKEYWGEDADEFRPERWRDTSHHHPMQFLSFGAGLRACPGRQFAMHELKMLFVALLTRYKFFGKPRDDLYEFDAPLFTFIIPNSPTLIKISRV